MQTPRPTQEIHVHNKACEATTPFPRKLAVGDEQSDWRLARSWFHKVLNFKNQLDSFLICNLDLNIVNHTEDTITSMMLTMEQNNKWQNLDLNQIFVFIGREEGSVHGKGMQSEMGPNEISFKTIQFSLL